MKKELMNHSQSVRFEASEYHPRTEYDEHERVTFSVDKYGFWQLRFYPEPKMVNGVLVVPTTPYTVVHKYSEYYLKTKC